MINLYYPKVLKAYSWSRWILKENNCM